MLDALLQLAHVTPRPGDAPRGDQVRVDVVRTGYRAPHNIALRARQGQPPSPPPDAQPETLRPAYVKVVLDRADGAPDDTRLGNPDGWLHASGLIGLCPRQYYLAEHLGAPDDAAHIGQRWTGGHLVTFAMGRGAEAHVKQQLVRTMGDRMYGAWSCVCGAATRMGTRPSGNCARCGQPLEHYLEPTVRHDGLRVMGRPDVTLLDASGHFVVVEIKTMARERWEALTAPLPDHIAQAATYWWLYRSAGQRMNPAMVFIYITKDFRFGSPYKEFHVNFEDPDVQTLIGLSLNLAAQVQEARANGTPPPRTLCPNDECTRARGCPVRTLCFNMN